MCQYLWQKYISYHPPTTHTHNTLFLYPYDTTCCGFYRSVLPIPFQTEVVSIKALPPRRWSGINSDHHNPFLSYVLSYLRTASLDSAGNWWQASVQGFHRIWLPNRQSHSAREYTGLGDQWVHGAPQGRPCPSGSHVNSLANSGLWGRDTYRVWGGQNYRFSAYHLGRDCIRTSGSLSYHVKKFFFSTITFHLLFLVRTYRHNLTT